MHSQEIVLCKHICPDEDDFDTIITEIHDIVDVMWLGLNLGIFNFSLDKIKNDQP